MNTTRRDASKVVHACLSLALLAAASGFGGIVEAQDSAMSPTKMESRTMMGRPDAAMVAGIIASWKVQPREVAEKLMAKYGAPHEATATRLIWFNNGLWKMTELVNEEIAHDFPKPHKDMLKQTIDYKVTPEDTDDLTEYDGSVIVERTKGEMAARCDQEEANFLAINLAHDVLTKKMSPKKAREFYSEAMLEMKHAEYKQGFVFAVSKTGQGDPDAPLKAEIAKMKK